MKASWGGNGDDESDGLWGLFIYKIIINCDKEKKKKWEISWLKKII